MEELRSQQSLFPQHFSYPANHQGSHKDLQVPLLFPLKENTKHNQTFRKAVLWESRRHSFFTRAESLPHLEAPSSTRRSQTHLCHLLSGPCPGHFWLYQTWMSAVSLRGPYSISKGNYFHFLEKKNTSVQDEVLQRQTEIRVLSS